MIRTFKNIIIMKKKNNIWISSLTLMMFAFFLINSCKKGGNPTPGVTTTTPTVSATSAVNSITTTTASSGGNVTSDGGATVTSRGVCWSTSTDPTTSNSKTTDGTGTGTFTSNLAGLSAATTYYVRAYAVNSAGTAYGTQVSFTSASVGTTPTISATTAVTSITTTTASSGGNVLTDGGTTITSRGVCWSTSANPTTSNFKTSDGTGTGIFTSSLTGLTAATIYYVRAYAVNSAGTAYGTQVSFTSATVGSGTTVDSVAIGTQIWKLKNLDVTTYRNGDTIPQVTDGAQWAGLTTGAWCYYNNDPANAAIYGKLYNWYAVNDPRGLAPLGWHIPTDTEWTTLTTFLGGESEAGGKMKEAGTTHWLSPNTRGTNESGYTGLPGGARFWGGSFFSYGEAGEWWSSTAGTDAWARSLSYNLASVYRDPSNRGAGFSVRCLKD
jgi:uncharacterized protein (TIGR02145 family)